MGAGAEKGYRDDQVNGEKKKLKGSGLFSLTKEMDERE